MNNTDKVLVALRRIIRATDLYSKRLSKNSGLTAPQLLLLQTIQRLGAGIAINMISKEINLSQATVTSIIDRLEARELVRRERSNIDKRKVNVVLTNAGTELIKEAPTPLQGNFIRRFQNLQDWEQSSILSSLQQMAYMMDAEEIDASPVLDLGAIDRADNQEIL